jgi:hypothetical protein
MPQRTVTGPVVDAAGIGIPSGELHITPVVPAGETGDGFVIQTRVYGIANGEVSARVVVPGNYRIEVFDEDNERIRIFTANISDASLADISLKEVWETRAAPIDVAPADVHEGDSILRLAPGGGLCGQVLQQHDGTLEWGDMQCDCASGSGDMTAAVYDPFLRRADVYDRTNHTGTQPSTSITGLGAAATKDVGAATGMVAAGDHTHGGATTTAGGFMSGADKAKLDGIATGATANQTNAYLLDRSHHTGTQGIGTITSLQSTLDAKADLVGGVVPTAQLPALAINDVFTVANQSAMLALTAQRGDIAVRSDTSTSYVLAADDPTLLANWVLLRSPGGGVSSVNGQTGTVVLGASDVGAASSTALSDHISDTENPHQVTAAQAGAVGLNGNDGIDGVKNFNDEILTLDKVRFYGAPAATTATNYVYSTIVSGTYALRMWSVGSSPSNVNGLEVVNNPSGADANFVRGYILGHIVFQCNSQVSGANSDAPDFYVRSRMTVENLLMAATQPSMLIRVVDGQSGDAITAVDSSDTVRWSISAAGKGSFNSLSTGPGTVPATPTSAGTPGDVAWDASYIYLCTGLNSWKKVGLGSEFQQTGSIVSPDGITAVLSRTIWRAPFACTAKLLSAVMMNGLDCTVNAFRLPVGGGASQSLAPTDLTLPAHDQFMTSSPFAVAFAAGDLLAISVRTANGSPTEVHFQIDFER